MKKILICGLLIVMALTYISSPICNVFALTNKTAYSFLSQSEDNHYDLTTLNIVLPKDWNLNTSAKVQYFFVDAKGESRGWIMSYKYTENFIFPKPNHSTIINDEYIDIPLGKCRLYTLDADTWTAAQGYTGGTHDDYYAVITLKDKVIYTVEFSMTDKNANTKKQFINILKKLSLKYE